MKTSVSQGRRRLAAIIVAALAVPMGLVAANIPAAQAQDNPYERGPDPTVASIEAERGSFAVSQATVGGGNGFGGGTIYYPTSTAEGTFGALAISPGFTAGQSSIAWLGPRVASQGFVVITIDTNSRYDQPSSRADQLRAALDYLVSDSSVRSRIDPSRLAVAGHSMGGGGSIEAASDDPSIDAVVAYQPYHGQKNWSGVRTPTMIQGAENDSIAPVGSHSEPFYESIPASSEKAYLEINNEDHFVSNSPDTTTAKYTISWLKRFVDDDTRYEQFLCPAPSGPTIEEYRDTCPHGTGGPTPTSGPTTTGPTTTSPTTTTTQPEPECAWWDWWCRRSSSFGW